VTGEDAAATEHNKALVRRHLEEAVSSRRPDVWADVMAHDFVLHHPDVAAGRDGYHAAVAVLWEGFPDLSEEILDLVAEGDRVAVRYVERGTHTGVFLGVAPSGRSYEKHGFALYRVEAGRLAEAWMQEDDLGFQRQVFG
jgi:predicted ester cyclase